MNTHSLIVIHADFEAHWPFVADVIREQLSRDGAVRLERLPRGDRRTLGEVAGDIGAATRVVNLGAPVTAACVRALAGVTEIALLGPYGPLKYDAETAAALAANNMRLIAHRNEGYWGQTVSEFGLALTLAALRRLPHNHAAMQTDPEAWQRYSHARNSGPNSVGEQMCDDLNFTSGTVHGKRVRVVGAGNIGARYASFCAALGAQVSVWDPVAADPAIHRAGAARALSIDALVRDAEIFAPMMPLVDATRGIVTAEHVRALPKGCLVVVVTRMGIIDAPALRERVLNDELLLAADVFDIEPVPLNDPLLGRHNVVHTPHIAGRTLDSNRQWARDLLSAVFGLEHGREASRPLITQLPRTGELFSPIAPGAKHRGLTYAHGMASAVQSQKTSRNSSLVLTVALFVVGVLLAGLSLGRIFSNDFLIWATSATGSGFVIFGIFDTVGGREWFFPYSIYITLAAGVMLMLPAFVRWRATSTSAAALVLAATTALICAAEFTVNLIQPAYSHPLVSLSAGLAALSALRMVYLTNRLDQIREQLTALVGQPGDSLDAALADVQTRIGRTAQTESLAHTQLRETAAQDERNRLARDLHDTIKQQLFSINVAAATAQSLAPTDPTGSAEMVQEVRNLAQQAQVEMKALLTQLRPEPLATVGLVQAIRDQLEALHFRSEVEVKLTGDGDALPNEQQLPLGAQEAIFRVVQEGLSNVARHARAKHTTVELAQTERQFSVRIIDDGQGFAMTADNAGMGIGNMRTRIAETGGTLTVTSAVGAGTQIDVRVPLTATASALPEADRHQLLDRWLGTAWANAVSFLGLIIVVAFTVGIVSAFSAPSQNAPVELPSPIILVLVLAAAVSVPIATAALQIFVRIRRHRLAKLTKTIPGWGDSFRHLLHFDDFVFLSTIFGTGWIAAWLGRSEVEAIQMLILSVVSVLCLALTFWSIAQLILRGRALSRAAHEWATFPWLRARFAEYLLNLLVTITFPINYFRAQVMPPGTYPSYDDLIINSINWTLTIMSLFLTVACGMVVWRLANRLKPASTLASVARSGLRKSDRIYLALASMVIVIDTIGQLVTPVDSHWNQTGPLVAALIYPILFALTRPISPLQLSIQRSPQNSDHDEDFDPRRARRRPHHRAQRRARVSKRTARPARCRRSQQRRIGAATYCSLGAAMW